MWWFCLVGRTGTHETPGSGLQPSVTTLMSSEGFSIALTRLIRDRLSPHTLFFITSSSPPCIFVLLNVIRLRRPQRSTITEGVSFS